MMSDQERLAVAYNRLKFYALDAFHRLHRELTAASMRRSITSLSPEDKALVWQVGLKWHFEKAEKTVPQGDEQFGSPDQPLDSAGLLEGRHAALYIVGMQHPLPPAISCAAPISSANPAMVF